MGRAVPWRLLAGRRSARKAALYQLLGALQAAEFLYEARGTGAGLSLEACADAGGGHNASLPRERRRSLHECTAQALEPSMLTGWRSTTGRWRITTPRWQTEKAVVYLQGAGAQAMQHSAYVEAVQHCTTGMEGTHDAPGHPRARSARAGRAAHAGSCVAGHQGSCGPESSGPSHAPGAMPTDGRHSTALYCAAGTGELLYESGGAPDGTGAG